MSWINHLPPACWSTFWKSNFKQQLDCRFDIMDNESYFFVFWHMQLYMSWYIRSFFGFTFLNIIYFFKYSCTNIFHRRSLYTFYCDVVSHWLGAYTKWSLFHWFLSVYHPVYHKTLFKQHFMVICNMHDQHPVCCHRIDGWMPCALDVHIFSTNLQWSSCQICVGGGWGGGGFSMVVATFSHVGGSLIFYGHHWGCLNNPIFFEFGVMCCMLSTFHV